MYKQKKQQSLRISFPKFKYTKQNKIYARTDGKLNCQIRTEKCTFISLIIYNCKFILKLNPEAPNIK